jgi:hypothetical protein
VTKQPPYMIVTEWLPCGSMHDVFSSGMNFPSIRRAVVMVRAVAAGPRCLGFGV